MPTAPSALSCCFSPPGVSFQPGWHLTLMLCLAHFPACTSWLWMHHSTAGKWPCFFSGSNVFYGRLLSLKFLLVAVLILLRSNVKINSLVCKSVFSPNSLSTRFGTVAVPNILLFQGAKPVARFNHTDRTLEMLSSFIINQTGRVQDCDMSLGQGCPAFPAQVQPRTIRYINMPTRVPYVWIFYI